MERVEARARLMGLFRKLLQNGYTFNGIRNLIEDAIKDLKTEQNDNQ